MGFQLLIEDGSYVQTLEVRTGALTVGRNPPGGLALSSPGLSMRHAVLRQAEDRVEVRAMPTKIGVRLNGERVDQAMLAAGESIQLGWARITVVEVTRADAAMPAPEAALELEALPAAAAVASASAAPAALGAPAAHAARHRPSEPPADFVVLSRKAVRALPWWGMSVAIHAVLFSIALLLPSTLVEEEPEDLGGFTVTLRAAPPRVEIDAAPPVEPTRNVVDVQRPDMAVALEPIDPTLALSDNPRGKEGTGPQRREDTGLVMDDMEAGSPWARMGGSSAIGVGKGARIGSGVGTNLDEVFGKGDADRANADAAGKLNGDPFTRSLVNGLRLRTSEENVQVVAGDYDHCEQTMRALGLRHGMTTPEGLARTPLGQDVRAVFYNCSGKPCPAKGIENLRKWVEEGGWLFTSDWAVENVVEKAFPGYLRVLRNGQRLVMTKDETITFTIAPGEHKLLAGLPPEAETSRWWLEDSSILFTVAKPEEVEVLAVSNELERRYGSRFVAITFPHGKGRVVHAVGHMFQREGNLRGAYAMQRLLLNFLYQAIRGRPEAATAAPARAAFVPEPRVRIEIEGVRSLEGALVSPLFSGASERAIPLALDARSSVRRPREWGTDASLSRLTLVGGGLPPICCAGPAEPLAKQDRPEWWLESRPGACGLRLGRVESSSHGSASTWSLRLDPEGRWVPIRFRRGSTYVRCRVTDPWTCETYESRADGLAYLHIRPGQTTGFLVHPQDEAPQRVFPRDLPAEDGVVAELVMKPGPASRTLRVRAESGERGPAPSARLEAFVWDAVTGGLIDAALGDGAGTVGSGLSFGRAPSGPLVVVAQVRSNDGSIWMGSWEGESTEQVSLRLESVRYWYESGQTGVRGSVTSANRSAEGELDVVPAAAVEAQPRRLLGEKGVALVPGRYRVRRTGVDPVEVEVRHGVSAVVPRR